MANEDKVQTLVDAISPSTSADDLLAISIAANRASTNVSSFVDTVANIPDLYTTPMPIGTTIFVVELNTYLVANVYQWVSMDGRVYRNDAPSMTVWGWGTNGGGTVGDNTTVNKSSPVSVVGGFADWCNISSGGNTNVGIRTNGTVWTWGCNPSGALGNNSSVFCVSSPVSVVGGFTDWCQVSMHIDSSHVVALRESGAIWAWGNNGNGQLGDGTATTKSSPVPLVGGFTDWKFVGSGNFHSFGIRTNGTLWAWGSNNDGQLGDNTVVSKASPVSVVGGFTDWCQVSGGGNHTLALRTNGTLWSWGSNGQGRLGTNSTTTSSSPVSVVGGFTDWCQVSAGLAHSIAVRTNGTLWAWGYATSGRLGDGTTTHRSSPVSVVGGFTDWCYAAGGSNHSLAVRANGTVWAWGQNASGQLGDNTTVSKSSPVSVVGGFTDWCQTSAGQSFSSAIRLTP